MPGARCEVDNISQAQTFIQSGGGEIFQLSTADVRKTLAKINPRKAAWPDNISGRVLRECADQLKDVLTYIFNTVSPSCKLHCRVATIVPVPKKNNPECLNDFCPVALIPIITKCFKHLVMQHVQSRLPPNRDPLQFV